MKKYLNWLLVIAVIGGGVALGVTKLTGVAIVNSSIDSTVIGVNSYAAAHFSVSQNASNVNPVPSQGNWQMWNLTGAGESDFVNHHGTGVGGFNWYDTTGSIGSPIQSLSPGGTLSNVNGFSTSAGNISTGSGNISAGGTITGSGGFVGNLSGSVSGASGLFSNSLGVYGTFNPSRANATFLGWNQSNGSGESDFFNQRGSGVGGFNFYSTGSTSTPGSPIVSISATGAVAAASFNGQVNGNVFGNVTGSLAGNASTATQLSANPGNCAATTPASGISANGTAECGSYPFSTSTNGYTTLPNGLILEWAQGNTANASTDQQTISFPLAFPHACLSVQASIIVGATPGSTIVTKTYAVNSFNASGVTVSMTRRGDDGSYQTQPIIFAIGY